VEILHVSANLDSDRSSENKLLEKFHSTMSMYQYPVLVTWGGRGFDVPLLGYRSMRYGLSMGWYYGSSRGRSKFSFERCWDLCDDLSDFDNRCKFSLQSACLLNNLPGKPDVDGSQVESLYKNGELKKISGYCLTDVIQTACLMIRTLKLKGELEWDAQHAVRLLVKGVLSKLNSLETDALVEETCQKILKVYL